MQFDGSPTRNEAPVEVALAIETRASNSKSNSNQRNEDLKLSNDWHHHQQRHHQKQHQRSPKRNKEKLKLNKLKHPPGAEEGVPLEITVEISPTSSTVSDKNKDGSQPQLALVEINMQTPPDVKTSTSDSADPSGALPEEWNNVLQHPFIRSDGGISPKFSLETPPDKKDRIPTPAPEHTDLERPFAPQLLLKDMKVTLEKPPPSPPSDSNTCRRDAFKMETSLSRGRMLPKRQNSKKHLNLNKESTTTKKPLKDKEASQDNDEKKLKVLEPVAPPKWISIKTTTPTSTSTPSPPPDGKKDSSLDQQRKTSATPTPFFPPSPLDAVEDNCFLALSNNEVEVEDEADETAAGVTADETAGAVVAKDSGKKKRSPLPKLSSHRGTDFVPGKKPPSRPSRKQTPPPSPPDENVDDVEDDDGAVGDGAKQDTNAATSAPASEALVEPPSEINEAQYEEEQEKDIGLVRMLNSQAEMMLARRQMMRHQERRSAYGLYDVMESSVPRSLGREDFSSSMVSNRRGPSDAYHHQQLYQDSSVASARSSSYHHPHQHQHHRQHDASIASARSSHSHSGAMMMTVPRDRFDDQASRRSYVYSEASYSRSEHHDFRPHPHQHHHHRGIGPPMKYIASPPSLPEGSRGHLSSSSISSDSRVTQGRGGYYNNRNTLSGYTDLSLVSQQQQDRLVARPQHPARRQQGYHEGMYLPHPYLGPADYDGRYPIERGGRGGRYVDPRYDAASPYQRGPREPYPPGRFPQDGYADRYYSSGEVVEPPPPGYRDAYFDGPPPPPPPPPLRPGGAYYHPADSRYHPDRWDEFSNPSYYSERSFRDGGRHYEDDAEIGVEEEEPLTVEIEPGFSVPLRRTNETIEAVSVDFFKSVVCFSCSEDIFSIADVEYVLCPGCRVISPVEDDEFEGRQIQRHGVGLGFTCESLFEMQQDILKQRSS